MLFPKDGLHHKYYKIINHKRNNFNNMEKEFSKFPVCLEPWIFLGLGWNQFNMCCRGGYGYDFGEIISYSNNSDFHKDIWNHENFIKLRNNLINGELPSICINCSLKRTWGIRNYFFRYLPLIKDENQKNRALENYNRTIDSIINKQTYIESKPIYLHIICGSNCNIKCKFCYNRNMNYNPNAKDLLNIIDKFHETLIFVTLSGGEPLITQAGRSLLKKFDEGIYKFGVCLQTNGQYFDFDLLKSVNLLSVVISTDAATKRTYENVRIGANFENLIKNIKLFIDLKKNEKPTLDILSNYTITSDNYIEIPEAVKLYQDLGLSFGFNLVQRDIDCPQNIIERKDLYDSFLFKINEGIENAYNFNTKNSLNTIKNILLNKINDEQEQQKFKEKKRKFIFFWKNI